MCKIIKGPDELSKLSRPSSTYIYIHELIENQDYYRFRGVETNPATQL